MIDSKETTIQENVLIDFSNLADRKCWLPHSVKTKSHLDLIFCRLSIYAFFFAFCFPGTVFIAEWPKKVG